MAKTDTDDDILTEARKRFERCVQWEGTARSNARMDARFAEGDAYNHWQWDDSVRGSRGDRPCLTNNLVRQHNLLIVNDARQNKAAIKVTPTGGKATYDAAQVLTAIIRRIEYQSKAMDAYSTAIFHQVQTGIGYTRVTTDYADEESFDQEIFINRIADPNTVYLDPDARDYDKADMRFAFVFTNIPRDQYESQYGTADNLAPSTLDYAPNDGWVDRDHVREAEYWRRSDDNDTLYQMVDGSTLRGSEMARGELAQLKPYIQAERDICIPEIEWFRIVGNKIIERKVWPGKYIPIVPFVGEEVVIDGIMDRKGHTRAMIDAQRIDNYWSSAAVEYVALQGKSPFIADSRATENHTAQWDTANTVNYSVLYYNGVDDQDRPVQPPVRAPAPVMPQAYIEGMRLARDDLMMVSGQHQADLGMPGNERSGKAIDARQRQGELATAHYIDNQAKGIRQVGRIVLDLIPKIYTRARVVQIMGEDGSDAQVHLVPNAPEAHIPVNMGPQGPVPLSDEQAKAQTEDEGQPDPLIIFNPNVGRYDVEADVGPSYGTRRQEAFNAFSQILAQNQASFPIVGDYWASNADFPGADQLAERLKRGLPPQYKPGPPPEVAMLTQQMNQQQQQFHELMQGAQKRVIDLERQLKDKGEANQIDDYKAETDRLKAVGQIDPMSLQIIVRQMVTDMLQTDLHPMLQNHAQIEAGLQQTMTPPEPVEPEGVQ